MDPGPYPATQPAGVDPIGSLPGQPASQARNRGGTFIFKQLLLGHSGKPSRDQKQRRDRHFQTAPARPLWEGMSGGLSGPLLTFERASLWSRSSRAACRIFIVFFSRFNEASKSYFFLILEVPKIWGPTRPVLGIPRHNSGCVPGGTLLNGLMQLYIFLKGLFFIPWAEVPHGGGGRGV